MPLVNSLRLGLEGFNPHSAIKNFETNLLPIFLRHPKKVAHKHLAACLVDLESYCSQRGCVPASFSSKKMHPYLQLMHSSASGTEMSRDQDNQ